MLNATVAVLLGQASPEDAGRMCGGIFVILALFAGLLKCIQIMRRPATHTICVLSLTITLTACLGASVLAVIQKTVVFQSHPVGAITAAVLSVGIFGMYITAVVLGIVGLVSYAREKAAYQQGRHQAVWGIVLGLALLGIGGYVAVKRLIAASNVPLVRTPVTPREVIDFEDLNFRIRVPDRPWVQVDVQGLNPDATVGFMRKQPELFFFVIAEQLGVEGNVTSDGLAAIAEANLKQAASRIDVGEKRPESISGVEGVRFESTAVIGRLELSYSHWVASHHGYVWQLIAGGSSASRSEVSKAARWLANRFEVIDLERSSVSTLEDIVAPQYGYTLRRNQSGCMPWADLHDDVPCAHGGLLFGRTHAFCVAPLRLDGFEPTDAELAAAFLAALDFDFPTDVTATQECKLGNATGRVFSTTRTFDGTRYHYRLRVLRNERFAYLLAGWGRAGENGGVGRIDEFAGRVELFEADEGLEFTPLERQAQAELFCYLGKSAYDARNVERALDYYRHAFSYYDSDEDVLNTIADLNDTLGQFQEALDFLDAHIVRFPNSRVTRANRAYQLARTGAPEQAVDIYRRVFTEGFEEDTYYDDFLEQLVSLGRFEEAHVRVDLAIARVPGSTWELRKARLYKQEQRWAEAIEWLRALQDKGALDPAIARELAECHWSAGEFAVGRKACERIIAQGQATADVYYAKGQCELSLRWYPEARTSFEEALRLDPTDDETRDLLAWLSTLLGQGDNSSIKQPIEPVAIPAKIRARIAELADGRPAAQDDPASARFETLLTGIALDPEQGCATTDYGTILIHSQRGVSDYSTLTFSFDPFVEDIHVNWVKVQDAAGKTIASGDVDAYYVVDAADEETASQAKLLYIPVPALAAGCRIDYAVTRREASAERVWPYREYVLAQGVPVRRRAVFASGDTSNLAYEASESVHVDVDPNGICWSMVDQPARRWEPLQPRYDTWLPMVVLSDRRATWEEVAEDYLSSIADRLEPDDATRALAERLTAGLTKPREMAAALARHVQQEYTYKAIEFGPRAQIPNKTDATIHSRYGDCKDLALLLRQLMTAVGLRADLALMNTMHGIQPELPAIDQFNHMVVYAPDLDDVRWIDCTEKYVDPLCTAQYAIADARILLLDPDHPRLIESEVVPGGTTIHIDRRIELVDRAHAVVEETLTLTGLRAARMRAFLDIWGEDRHKETLQRLLAAYGAPQLRQLEITQFESPEQPLVMHLVYRTPDVLHETSAELAGRLPAPWESYYLAVEFGDARQSPFELDSPLRIESTVHVVLPEGFAPTDPAALGSEGSTPYLGWAVEAKRSPDALVIESRVSRKTGRFSALEYADFHSATEDVLRALAPRVMLAPTR